MPNKLDLNIIPTFKINFLTKVFIQMLIKMKFSLILGLLYSRIILHRSKLSRKNKDKVINILALSPERFRDDLRILEKKSTFKIWIIPTILQTLIQGFFYKDKIVASQLKNPEKVFNLEINKKKHRLFLKKILKIIFRIIPIDFVISADIKYVADIDWGEVSNSLGKSYLVLHRENLAACKSIIDLMIARTKKIRKFGGTHIIVQNKIMKDVFTKTQFAKASQVSVKGCLRMDELFTKIKTNNFKKNKNDNLILFSSISMDTKTSLQCFCRLSLCFYKDC